MEEPRYKEISIEMIDNLLNDIFKGVRKKFVVIHKPGVNGKPFDINFKDAYWPLADTHPERTKKAFDFVNSHPTIDAHSVWTKDEFQAVCKDPYNKSAIEFLTKNGKLSIHEFKDLCWRDRYFLRAGTTDLGGEVLDVESAERAYAAYLKNDYSIRMPEGLKQIKIMKNYRKKNVQPMQEYTKGMDMMGVSVSVPDVENGSPKEGDMIATNPNDPNDRWLIAEKFFQDNYELAATTVGKSYQNTDADGAKKNVKDIVFFGNGDTFKLISKASSKNEQWMKSTKAMAIDGAGCVIQVTTQQGNNVSEALTFVAGVKIQEYYEADNKTIKGRTIVKF